MLHKITNHDEGRLSYLGSGESGVITKVMGHGAFRKRITEMGFVKGKTVKVIKNAPLQDPVEYEIMGYNVSLRKSEARLIEVSYGGTQDIIDQPSFEGFILDNVQKNSTRAKGKEIKVALVGNPNCGKTTLFNHASGLHEKVGNYGGVTIDSKEAGISFNNYYLSIVDLPGTYSITEYTPEELFVRMHLLETMPDVVINVIDASNIERNLFLTTQLIDMSVKVVIALNMYDELLQNGVIFKYETLGTMLGIPIVPTVAVKGKGIDALMQKVIDVYEDKDPIARHVHINYGISIETAISTCRKYWIKIQRYQNRVQPGI
jgi:ferrous iron transport protein B